MSQKVFSKPTNKTFVFGQTPYTLLQTIVDHRQIISSYT